MSPGLTDNGAPPAEGFGFTIRKSKACPFVACAAACRSDWLSVRTYQHLRSVTQSSL